VLEGLLRQQSTPQALALRVRIVLAAATGMRNVPLAQHLGCTPKTVIKWRARWAAAEAELAALEHNPADLKRLIARVLADAPRPGAPDTFTAEQIIQIINLACTPPADAGRPVDAWTPRELADEAVKRQIVPSISPTSVGRFLKAGRASAASQPLLAQREVESRSA
jgi:putative transposase